MTIQPHMPKEVKQQGEMAFAKESWFLKLFILAVIFGFVSGIVGGMIVNSRFFDNWFWGEGGAWKSLINTTPSRQDARSLSRDNLTRKSLSMTAEIYLAKDISKEGLLASSQKIASGFFLTSNGYLATAKSLFDKYNKKDLVVADQEKKIYLIEKVIVDPISDLAIIKINGEGFASAPFMFEDDLSVDLDVWLPLPQIGLYQTKVLAINAFLPQTKADYYLSSETLYRYGLIKNRLEKSFLGSPLFNTKGEIAGMLIGDLANNEFNRFLKVGAIQTAIKQVLDNGLITRSFLGVHYLELEEHNNLRSDLKRGIILTNDPYHGFLAVEKKSPLTVLGLKADDVILEVNGESLTSWKSLPEILLDYNSGNKIQIKYQQDKEEKTITLELGSKK